MKKAKHKKNICSDAKLNVRKGMQEYTRVSAHLCKKKYKKDKPKTNETVIHRGWMGQGGDMGEREQGQRGRRTSPVPP